RRRTAVSACAISGPTVARRRRAIAGSAPASGDGRKATACRTPGVSRGARSDALQVDLHALDVELRGIACTGGGLACARRLEVEREDAAAREADGAERRLAARIEELDGAVLLVPRAGIAIVHE